MVEGLIFFYFPTPKEVPLSEASTEVRHVKQSHKCHLRNFSKKKLKIGKRLKTYLNCMLLPPRAVADGAHM